MRYGFFDNAAREYVIDRVDLPGSWTNYLGVEDFCTVISQNAGGYSFCGSPQHRRITRFRANSVPPDRPGHTVYLRDNATGDAWSVSWQPVGKPLEKARYECRHGLSYSRFTCSYAGIDAAQTLFVPLGEKAELWDVRVRNTGSEPRELSVFGYVEFSFHNIEIDNQNLQMSLYCAGSRYRDGVVEYNAFYENVCDYFTAGFDADSFDCLRDVFLGPYRTETNPLAVEQGRCSGSFEKGGNHCGALQKAFTLAPGEEKRFLFMLGVGGVSEAKEARRRYARFDTVDGAFQELAAWWDKKLGRLQVDTPSEGMNTSLNLWNLYQAEINVIHSRFASFIEVGGRTGLGYRDTAQDAMCVPHSNPGKTRVRLVQLLNGLTSAGYGLHLFEPEWFEKEEEPAYISPTVIPAKKSDRIHGLKDACSDDALWLVPALCEYIKETGDLGFAEAVVPYADGGEGSVYDHMRRILDFSAQQVGQTGICKGLRADWNDCLNLGGGESALTSFLHHWALGEFILLARRLGRAEDAGHYGAMQKKVAEACEAHLWDGGWYLRGITKRGAKIGTAADREGRVHLESNAWAVLSGVAHGERAERALQSIHDYLATPYGIRLNAPSYTKPDDDIGFITRVYPGVKENGAIFSHSNPWVWAAECTLGHGTRAMEYYQSLLPFNQNDRIEVRQAEPYAYCQFVMGPDHTAFGRARHPWLTGSAGWAYFAATHYMLGIRPGYDALTIDPCIPAAWKSFSATRIWRGATYRIRVENPDGAEKGVCSLTLNGVPAEAVAPMPSGSVNDVEAVLGRPE